MFTETLVTRRLFIWYRIITENKQAGNVTVALLQPDS